MSCRQAQGWHNFRLDYLAQALGYSFQADFTLTWLDAARRGHGNCESSKPAKLRLINPPETPESVSEFGTETETEPGQAWYLRVPLWGRCLKPDRLRRFACADATHKSLDPLMRQLFSALPRPHPSTPTLTYSADYSKFILDQFTAGRCSVHNGHFVVHDPTWFIHIFNTNFN